MAPAPALIDDNVEEILLRLPPDDPASLLRASVVCKSWRHLLTDAAFLRRYRALHRTPPLLGFIHSTGYSNPNVCFIPDAPFRPRRVRFRYCHTLDCGHGRVLLHDLTAMDLLLWDPVTGEQRHIPIPDIPRTQFSAAVMCAAAGCDHLDCHGGAFRVAFVGTGNPDWVARAFVYSSEAGEWSTPATAEFDDYVEMQPPVLTGDALYFICQSIAGVLSYDLRSSQGLSVIDRPDENELYSAGIALIAAEDGGLIYAGLRHYYSLDLWSLETMGTDGAVRWTQLRVIQLENLIAIADPLIAFADPSYSPYMMCIAKGPNDSGHVIFMATNDGIYMIGLESQSIRKVCEGEDVIIDYPFFPYRNFFTPVIDAASMGEEPQGGVISA